MSVSSLLPIGGAALGLLATKALASLSTGPSFRSLLGAGEDSATPTNSPQASVTLNLEEALPQFVSQLRARLQAAGVNLSQPVTLKDDGNGTILVDGDHSDRTVIEQILAQDIQLRSRFHEIATTAAQQRQDAVDNPFGEFRLALHTGFAAIRFE